MKRLLTSTAVCAVVLGMNAQPSLADHHGQDQKKAEELNKVAPAAAQPDISEKLRLELRHKAEMAETPVVRHEGAAILSSKGLSVRQLIGASALNSEGVELGEVEDTILGRDGYVKTVVLNDGGFFGMAGDDVAVAFDDMAKVVRDGDDVEAHITFSDASLENHTAFDAKNLPAGQKLVSEMFGDDVDIEGTDRDAEIHDVILTPDGRATYVVLEFGGILDIGDKRVLVEYERLSLSADDDEKYTASLSEEAILKSEGFYYTLAEVKFSDKYNQ